MPVTNNYTGEEYAYNVIFFSFMQNVINRKASKTSEWILYVPWTARAFEITQLEILVNMNGDI